MLSISNLSKSFGKKEVLANINVALQEGKMYGFVGRNGAGKTTLFNCIVGIETYQGEIHHSDINLFKNIVGYMPTELFFFARITGLEYIAYMLHAKKVKLSINDIKNQNIFNLPLDNFISTYSNGMKKLLAFTAIYLQKNNWYILDEPTNGVDLENNLILKKTLLELKKQKATILISSHILESLYAICDTIFIVKDKKIQAFLPNTFSLIEREFV